MGDRGVVTHAWYPDERAHAGPEHLDDAYVAGYDAKTQLDLESALELLRRNGLDADAALVDHELAAARAEEIDAHDLLARLRDLEQLLERHGRRQT